MVNKKIKKVKQMSIEKFSIKLSNRFFLNKTIKIKNINI
jgi:hypothetical protein